MPFSSSELLQFPEVRLLISQFAGSDAGRLLTLAIEPFSELRELQTQLSLTEEAIRYVSEVGGSDVAGSNAKRLPFAQLPDVTNALRILPVEDARLEGREILDIFRTLEVAAECLIVLRAVAERFPLLSAYCHQLVDLRPIVSLWSHAFLPDGGLQDSASTALARLRRDIGKQQRAIQQSLERFLRSHQSDGTLQENFVTVRDDRYVVPIVAGQKGRVNGIIHGASGSGRSLFVEPLETIDLNNQLVRLREDEVREVERILAEISGQLRSHHPGIASTVAALADLDCVFAKAEFAKAYRAVVPKIVSEVRHLRLERARHPLLETVLRKAGRTIVPISLRLDSHQRCLLISGPNTGGKTVTMKTVGLLALMAHAALPLPCDIGEVPFFDDILADIGDSQSIEESLSSFSGHLLHIRQMLETSTENSLVLLDELGRATDPEEGGALGVAILDQFRQSGAFCLASTHLSPLKVYGAQTSGVLNGSMGFDEATLQPTYELRLGIPGKSAGLDIATRMQLPANLIAHARTVLPRLEADFQGLLRDLHRQSVQNELLQAELAESAADLKRRRIELESDSASREEKRQREWARKREELIADFEMRALLSIERIQSSTKDAKKGDEAKQLFTAARREFVNDTSTPMEPPAALNLPVPVDRSSIDQGARLRIRGLREPVTVLRVLKNGALEVEAGLMKLQVSREDVQQVLPPETARPKARLTTGPRHDVSTSELNLIGQRSEEAIGQLDKFLDAAALSSTNRVRIIHGHGMGILKRAVSDYLALSPHVEKFYPATPAEGGSGATIAELH